MLRKIAEEEEKKRRDAEEKAREIEQAESEAKLKAREDVEDSALVDEMFGFVDEQGAAPQEVFYPLREILDHLFFYLFLSTVSFFSLLSLSLSFSLSFSLPHTCILSRLLRVLWDSRIFQAMHRLV